MHKCFKCGTEFEGKFCPECGTQWLETKNCPQCGAALAGSAKFCNNCGYSFVESAEAKRKKQPSKIGIFFKKVWAWIRAHLKVIIPTACSLVVAIVICSLIPTFIAMGVNGTYYAYSFDEKGEIVYSEKDYITLSSGKWKDSDGNKGTYSRSGKNVTLKYRDQSAEDFGDIMGDLGVEVPTEVKLKATVVNGVLTVTDGTREETYVTKRHKHKYGKWEVTKEPTCTLKGEQKHSCACKKIETDAVAPKGHTLNDDYVCAVCGRQFTKGLEYKYLSELNGYTVAGIGTATENDIVIPDNYNRKPVIAIMSSAFEDCSGLTSITIPNSVTSIGYSAFKGCYKLIQTENGVSYVDKWIIDCNNAITSVIIRDNTVGIGGFALSNCNKLTSITLPNSVTSIGRSAFYGCNGLTSITIGNSVASIGASAFEGCKGLTSITIPDSVTTIGASAFEGCKGLTSITIPDSVTTIGRFAFNDCNKLTNIQFNGTKAQWKKIKKDYDWDNITGYTIQCTDGKINKY